MILLEEVKFFFKLIPISFIGFWASIYTSIKRTFFFWKGKSILEKSSILSTFIQFILSPTQWISYKVIFMQTEEVVNISADINLWVLASCSILFLLQFFWKEKWFSYLFAAIQSLLFLTILVGALLPNLYMVKMIERSDYYFNSYFWYFSTIHIVCTILSGLILLNRKGSFKNETA